MRNRLRVLGFDVVVPLLALAALLLIGLFLGWPLWWVSVCSMLGLLIVEAMVFNYLRFRRDRVTMGTDDDGPGLRLAAVGLLTVAVGAALVVGYTQVTQPERQLNADADEVVRLSSAVSEATATYSPQDPDASIDRAVALMVPEQAEAFKANFAKTTEALASKKISAQAQTLSAGVEALGPMDASVLVMLRATQQVPGQAPGHALVPLRVGLTKQDGHWLVFGVTPLSATAS